MKKITDKDVERLKAGKKITKGFIHMQLDDKGRLNSNNSLIISMGTFCSFNDMAKE